MLGLSKREAETIIKRRLPLHLESGNTEKTINAVISGVADAIEENNKKIGSRVNMMIDDKLRRLGSIM